LSRFFNITLLNIHNIINRYRRKVSLYNERVGELNNVTQQRDNIKKQYDEWRKKRHAYPSLFLFPICVLYNPPLFCQFFLNCIWYDSRLDEFMAGFNAISLKLKEMYQVGE
jgi:structural maintenance of chromosome 4